LTVKREGLNFNLSLSKTAKNKPTGKKKTTQKKLLDPLNIGFEGTVKFVRC